MGSKNKMITGKHMLQVEQINTGNPSLFGIFSVLLWLLFLTFYPWGFITYWHWYPRANRMRSNFKWTACHLTVPLGNLSRALFKLFVVRNMWGLQSIKISLWRVYTQPYRRSCSQNTLTLTFKKMLESSRGFLKWEWVAMSASLWMWHRAELRNRFQVGKHMASLVELRFLSAARQHSPPSTPTRGFSPSHCSFSSHPAASQAQSCSVWQGGPFQHSPPLNRLIWK